MRMYVECGKPCWREKPPWFFLPPGWADEDVCWVRKTLLKGKTAVWFFLPPGWAAEDVCWVTSSLRSGWMGVWFWTFVIWTILFLLPWSMHWNILQRFLLVIEWVLRRVPISSSTLYVFVGGYGGCRVLQGSGNLQWFAVVQICWTERPMLKLILVD